MEQNVVPSLASSRELHQREGARSERYSRSRLRTLDYQSSCLRLKSLIEDEISVCTSIVDVLLQRCTPTLGSQVLYPGLVEDYHGEAA